MIVFVYGTTAEAIKVAPVARRLTALGVPFQQWLTMQHTQALLDILPGLGLPEPDRFIANGRRGEPLKSSKDVIPWLWSVRRWMSRNVAELRRSLPDNTVVVVHGDTMTTVVGAYLAKRLRKPSAHIEAGLRSGNWRHPFPEELDRRIVGKLATIHYTPSIEATQNMGESDHVVHTHGNTVLDAVLDNPTTTDDDAPKYGIVLLHRFEFMGNKQLVEETVAALAEHTPVPVRFIVDEFAEGALADVLPTDNPRILKQKKLRHEDFINVLRGAEFVVTDSGGIQAESALVGIPTLIHRKATEQSEGIGRNIVLSGWDVRELIAFLENYERYRHPALKPEFSPSDIIVADLVQRGYAVPAAK